MSKLPDLTTPGQKLFAGGLLIFTLMLLWFLLPPLIVILSNLVITLVLAGVILVAAVNYNNIWDAYKQLSWAVTKNMISSNKLWYLDKGYEYLVEQFEEFKQAVQEVLTSKIKSERKQADLITEYNRMMSIYNTGGLEPLASKELEAKIAISKRQIDSMQPYLVKLENQYSIMSEIAVMRESDLRVLKHELEAKKDEYEALKDMSSASDKASKFLGENNSRSREFKESLRQLESSVSEYTANIEVVNTRMLPKLQEFASNQMYNEEQGKLIIEEYNKSRLNIN